jgi:hypothetical protein
MQNRVRRMLSVAMVLAVLTAPVMAATAEASHSKYQNSKRRQQSSYQNRSGGKHHSNRSYRSGRSGGRRHEGRRYEGRRSHHHGGHSDVVPFIGGLAVGAIIGSHAGHSHGHGEYCPPPRPRRHVVRRVYVYHCDCCDSRYRSYDSWTEHLVVAHHVPSYEVHDYYPQNDGGYWEEY